MPLPTEPVRLKSLLMSHTADLPLKVSVEQYEYLQAQRLMDDPQLSERVKVE